MVGMLTFIVFTGIPRDSLEDRLAAPSSPAPEPETHLTALAGDRPLWVTIPRALDALPRDVPARLLGFHPDTRRSPDDRVVLEWMVEALIDARPSSRKRFFLVPEAGDIVAVEIAPVAWLERPRAFPPIRLLLHSADAGRLIGGQPAYRVYMVSDPASLGAAVPEAALSAAPLFPRVVDGAAGLSHDREWVFPALWKN
jgi:hypothetical protein